MVKRYPHSIQIKVSSGSLVIGKWEEGSPELIDVDCNIQQQSNSYKNGSKEDSRVCKWRIFCKIFDGSNTVKIGDTVIPVSGITEFDLKAEHKIISYIIYQKHIEIEV
jgi:hypothetical protein